MHDLHAVQDVSCTGTLGKKSIKFSRQAPSVRGVAMWPAYGQRLTLLILNVVSIPMLLYSYHGDRTTGPLPYHVLSWGLRLFVYHLKCTDLSTGPLRVVRKTKAEQQERKTLHTLKSWTLGSAHDSVGCSTQKKNEPRDSKMTHPRSAPQPISRLELELVSSDQALEQRKAEGG